MNREIRKLIKKVDDLQKQLNQQNGYIIDQTIIIQKLIEKIWVIPTSAPLPNSDPNFWKDVPWVPYKGPDCEKREVTPVYHKSYDGTMTTLPIKL